MSVERLAVIVLTLIFLGALGLAFSEDDGGFSGFRGISPKEKVEKVSYYFVDDYSYQFLRRASLHFGTRSANYQLFPLSLFSGKFVFLLGGWIFFPLKDEPAPTDVSVKVLEGKKVISEIKVPLEKKGGYLYLSPVIMVVDRGSYSLEIEGQAVSIPQVFLNRLSSPICSRYRGEIKEVAIKGLRARLREVVNDKDLSDTITSREDALIIIPEGVVEELSISGNSIKVVLTKKGDRKLSFPKAIYLGTLSPGNYTLKVVTDGKEEVKKVIVER